jgi:hypothetical protein
MPSFDFVAPVEESPLQLHSQGSTSSDLAVLVSTEPDPDLDTPSSPDASTNITEQSNGGKVKSRQPKCATASNPLYGYVQGVLHGPNSPHSKWW